MVLSLKVNPIPIQLPSSCVTWKSSKTAKGPRMTLFVVEQLARPWQWLSWITEGYLNAIRGNRLTYFSILYENKGGKVSIKQSCLDVLCVVLQLVEDDAGAGHAGALQEAHQVHHEGAAELPDQAAVTQVILLIRLFCLLYWTYHWVLHCVSAT